MNLPFTRCEVGLDHARSVSPVSLAKTQNLVGLITGEQFKIVNPFIFCTKGQMCASLKKLNWENLAYLSASCDRKQRKTPSQCGICSSCLLRRQALLAAGILDETPYINADLRSQGSHLLVMQAQVATILRATRCDDPWAALVNEYPSLGETIDLAGSSLHAPRRQLKKRLIDLYRRYAEEWRITGFGDRD
jgi:hypothetical protein